MTQKIEAIIFDLGGVLVDFDHTIAAKKFMGMANKELKVIYDLFFSSGITALFEEGKISAQGFFEQTREMLGLKIDFEEFYSIWNKIFFFTEKNLFVYALAKRLKQNYKLALLTNVNIMHFEYLKKNFPVFDVFHTVLTSFEVGFTKPSPLIYQKALSALKVDVAEKVFYTDDREDLIKEASALGFKAHVFKGSEKLLQDLKKSGVLVN